VSFAGELKGFVSGFKAGSDIMYRNAARKNIEMNLPLFGPEDYRAGRVPGGAFQPGQGGGVGTASAPQVDPMQTGSTGGKGAKIKRTGNDELANRRDAIAMIESGGNYRAVGPVVKGDRAYGRYQVMGNNIPAWTKQALGRSMTPGEFMANEQAQDRVFDVMFDGYIKQFGYPGAAQAWFGGPGSVGKSGRTDPLGTSVGNYGKMFLSHYRQLGGQVDKDPMASIEASPSADWQPRAAAEDEPYYDPQQQQAAAEPAIEEPEEEGVTAESPVITAPEVDLSPQVQEPELVGDEEEEHYEMGGIIPEDDDGLYFAAGGQTNPAYQQANTGYTPPQQARRIMLPAAGTVTGSPGWRDWGASGSPNQVKLTAARNKLAADRAAAAAAAVPPPPPPVVQQSPYVWSAQRGGPQGKETFQTFGDFFNTIRTGQMPPRVQSGSARYGSHAAGGMVGYARGGKVAKKPVTTSTVDWAEANRRAGKKPSFEETIAKYRRPGSSRGDVDQEARDRAAREMNARAGRPSSTAWREPYLRPKAAPGPAAPPVALPQRQRPIAPVGPTTTVDPVRGGAPDDGRMPQVDTMGNPVGANYPEGFATPGEVTEAIKQDPGWEHVQKKQQEYRDRAENPQIDVPVVDPVTGQPLETQPAMAGGGAIPDDTRFARGGRVEEAGYTTSGSGKRSSARRKDPWEGLRTKTSKKVRKPSTKSVKRGAAKRKKKVSQPGRERRQQLPEKGPIPRERPQTLPERGPVPPARPGVTAAPAAPGPQQGPPAPISPNYGPSLSPDSPGMQIFQQGPRPQQGPPAPVAPYRGHPGAPGAPVVGGSPPVVRGPRPQQGPPQPGGLGQPIGSLPPARPPFRPADTQGAQPPPPANYRPDLAEAQAVRGGGASPSVSRSVTPARPGNYGPPLGQGSPGMQAFQGEAPPGEPLPERFGRGPEAEPLPERFGREPVRAEELPPEYYDEELETSSGMAFQRGGVIPDDTDGPFRQRKGGRGGLRLLGSSRSSYAKSNRR
jgi:hypothetical protein